jgi:hypothetical protein
LVFEEYFPKGTNLDGKKLTLPLRNAFDFEIKGRLSWIVPPSSPWEVKGYSDEIFTMAPGEEKSPSFTIHGKMDGKKSRPALLPKLMVRFKAEAEPLDLEMLMDVPLAK